MKRALLVTTGTVVGITSVLAYKPNVDAISHIPGAEALSSSAGTRTGSAARSAAARTANPASTTPPAAAANSDAESTSSPAETAQSATGSSLPNGTHSGGVSTVESHGRTYGSLVASVTVTNGRMSEISFQQDPSGRNAPFIDAVNTYLIPEILRTQNVTVGIVSGATGTSMALIHSLQSALGMV